MPSCPPLLTSASAAWRIARRSLLVLQAAALHGAGRVREMHAALTAASRLGQGYGYRRVFLDDAALLQPLLKHAGAGDLAWLSELLAPSAAPSHASAQASHELTKRELRILARLESGLSNREIAESLFISESTLKWHLHNVYGKLDVRSRSGATAKAKQLQSL